MIRVAINGFGRIGRNFLRCWLTRENSGLDIVAINNTSDPKTACHLLKYDSLLGRLDEDVSFTDDTITVGNKTIKCCSDRNPNNLPWGAWDIDLVIESTGVFVSEEGARRHIEAGAKQVLITAPGKGGNVDTYVVGVNDSDYVHAKNPIISNASCTTNCLAPVVKVVNDAFGIIKGTMTTTHSYTGDQPTLDRRHKDLYRARSAAMAMIPTSTGAAKAIGQVLPELAGKLDGSAIRVPTPNVSAVDLTFEASRAVTVENVNEVIAEAAAGHMGAVLAYDPEPKVSIDFNHTPQSSIFAPEQTKVVGKRTVRVLAWYDNEWGFSCRMADVASAMGRLLH